MVSPFKAHEPILIHMWHDSSICVTRIVLMCDTNRTYVWHDSKNDVANPHEPTLMTWLIHICDTTHSHMWNDPPRIVEVCVICVPRLANMWHDPFTYVAWLIYICEKTFSGLLRCVVCAPWLTNMWHDSSDDLTIYKNDSFGQWYSHMWHDSLTEMKWSEFQTDNRNRGHFLVYFAEFHLFHSISFENRNRNRVVPVTFECVTICDIWDQNVTKSVFPKKPKKNPERLTEVTNSKLWHLVTVTNVTNGHTLNVTNTNPVSVSVWNPDQNDPEDFWDLSYVCHDSPICDTTHAWHDSSTYVKSPPEDCWGVCYMCAMTHPCVTWLLCDMTHIWHFDMTHVWHGSYVICLNCDVTWRTMCRESKPTNQLAVVKSHITRTHSYVWHASYVTWCRESKPTNQRAVVNSYSFQPRVHQVFLDFHGSPLSTSIW